MTLTSNFEPDRGQASRSPPAMATEDQERPRRARVEIAPMIGGEGTSPSRWMARIERATAVALSVGATRLTMAELIGPVDANRRSSAITIALM